MKEIKFDKKLMITGCGRSGTRYITFLLRRLGLDVGHETVKEHGIASWCTAVDAEQTPWGISAQKYNFEQIFHQIRHPLMVIPSTCSFKENSWQYICDHIPVSMDEPIMLRSAKYWYYWNLEAEKICEWSYRIEDVANVFDEFCERLNIPTDRLALESTPDDINTRRRGQLIHLYDELMEHLFLNPSNRFRKKLERSPTNKSNRVLTWDTLKSLDYQIYLKVKKKAREYGYND